LLPEAGNTPLCRIPRRRWRPRPLNGLASRSRGPGHWCWSAVCMEEEDAGRVVRAGGQAVEAEPAGDEGGREPGWLGGVRWGVRAARVTVSG